MNTNDPCREATITKQPLEIDQLLTDDQRRTCSVEIDPRLLDRPPGRRSEGEISRLDAIFSELERREG